MALWRSMRLSLVPLQEETSALVCTPVTSARRQLKSMPVFLLAWSVATQACSEVKGEQASVRLPFCGSKPADLRLASSFLSRSLAESRWSLLLDLDFFIQCNGL